MFQVQIIKLFWIWKRKQIWNVPHFRILGKVWIGNVILTKRHDKLLKMIGKYCFCVVGFPVFRLDDSINQSEHFDFAQTNSLSTSWTVGWVYFQLISKQFQCFGTKHSCPFRLSGSQNQATQRTGILSRVTNFNSCPIQWKYGILVNIWKKQIPSDLSTMKDLIFW